MIMDMYFGQMQQCKVVQESGLPGLIFIILPAHLTTNKNMLFYILSKSDIFQSIMLMD